MFHMRSFLTLLILIISISLVEIKPVQHWEPVLYRLSHPGLYLHLWRTLVTELCFHSLAQLSPDAAQLPPPQLDSVIMRHVLRWRPVQDNCSYSVKFKGQYEVETNSNWVEAPSCQKIIWTECDLTHDLASGSDYQIGVEAQCVGETSWAELFFNSSDRLLDTNMSVKVTGHHIEISFQELHRDTTVVLRLWKKGDEQNVYSKELTGPRTFFDVEQDGETYCLEAEVRLEGSDPSNSTETQCVLVPKPELTWIKYLIVGITVALTLAIALALGLMTSRYCPRLRKIMNHKEPLPTSLLTGWPEGKSTFSFWALLETVHSVALLQPQNEQDRGSEIHEGHRKSLLDC